MINFLQSTYDYEWDDGFFADVFEGVVALLCGRGSLGGKGSGLQTVREWAVYPAVGRVVGHVVGVVRVSALVVEVVGGAVGAAPEAEATVVASYVVDHCELHQRQEHKGCARPHPDVQGLHVRH